MKTIPYKKGLHKLTDKIYTWLEPPGSWGLNNAGLIFNKGKSLLIDTLYDLKYTAEMKKEITAVIGDRDPDQILVTHANGDHFYGCQLFPGSEVIASRLCAKEMLELPPGKMAMFQKLYRMLGKAGKYFHREFGKFDFRGIKAVKPGKTFQGESVIDAGGLEVRVKDLGPMHTKSDSIVWVPSEKTVFAGDLLFIEGTPICWEGHIENAVKALDYIADLKAEYIVPGHGPLTDSNGVAGVRDYFKYVYSEAEECFMKGMDYYEAAKSINLDIFSSLHFPERIVINVASFYRQFDKKMSKPGPVKLFALMQKYIEEKK